MKDNDKGVRLPIQEIVDLFHKGDFKEMTKQIDQYEGYNNYWTELAVDMETYTNHEDDYSIFTQMVIEYTWEKTENKEKDLKDILLKFNEWMNQNIKEYPTDEEVIYLCIEDYLKEVF